MTHTLSLALLFATLVLGAQPARTAEEYTDAFPADLVRLLMDFGGQGEFAVYDGIMDEFPDFRLPAGFEVAGSLRQSVSLRVALRTELDEDTAVPRLVEQFTGNDWVEMPQFEPFSRETGFISPDDPRRRQRPSVQLCNDDQGSLSVSFTQREGESYVMLSASNRNSPFGGGLRNCAEQIAQMEESMAMRNLRGGRGLAQYMPRMELPAVNDEEFRPVRVGGFSGSSQEMETEAGIRVDWDMEELYEHLAGQIVAQDWVLDSNSVGAVSATGTWTNSTAGPGTYIGTLTIVATGDDRYDLKFVIRSQGGSGSGGVFIAPGG